jgi:asparagine synthetase A
MAKCLPYTLLDVYKDIFDTPLRWSVRSANYDDEKAHERVEFHCSNGWIIVKATRYIDYIELIQLEIHNKETGYMTTLNWTDTNESSKSVITLIAKSICDNRIYPIRYYT